MMVAILVSTLVLGLPQKRVHLNWNGPAMITIQGKSRGHSYRVRFEQANFQPRGRKLKWASNAPGEESRYPFLIRGGKWAAFRGHDGYSVSEIAGRSVGDFLSKHVTEVVAITVWIDKKRTVMPKGMFDDLLDPNFDAIYKKAGFLTNKRTFQIQLEGSDGAGGYAVDWWLSSGGKWTRKVKEGD